MFDMKNWSEKFFNQPVFPMPKELSKMFLGLSYIDGDVLSDLRIQDEFSFSLVDKRAKWLNLNMTDSVKAFLILICETPAEIVMYLSALKEKADDQLVDMRFLTSCFPLGFPGQDSMFKLWDLQKENNSNNLDKLRYETTS